MNKFDAKIVIILQRLEGKKFITSKESLFLNFQTKWTKREE